MLKEILNYRCFPRVTRNGDMNFIGAAIAFFDENNARVKDEATRKGHIQCYNNTIFPIIDVDLPIADYTDQIFEDLLARLQVQNDYSESTMTGSIHHLLYDPYKSYLKWSTPEWLLETHKLFGKNNAIPAGEQLLKIPKSLTVKRVLLLADYLLENPEKSSGEEVGLSVMFLSAVRNSESCGFNFGDMIEYKEHPGYYYLRLFETTEGSSNRLKGSGKTTNAPRLLPIPPVLSDFIKAREAFVVTQLSFPCVDRKGKSYESIKDVPIACRGTNYLERCGANDLTDAGKKLLRGKLRYSEKELSSLEETIAIFFADEKNPDERDPTTYLFRRNAATILYLLGFSLLQIYYYMGHELRDELFDRSDFVDEEYLYEMSLLLDNHPLNPKKARETITLDGETSVVRKNVTSLELVLPAGKTYNISIRNRETGDSVKTTIQGGAGMATIMATDAFDPPGAEVNVTNAIRRLYEQARKELNEELGKSPAS